MLCARGALRAGRPTGFEIQRTRPLAARKLFPALITDGKKLLDFSLCARPRLLRCAGKARISLGIRYIYGIDATGPENSDHEHLTTKFIRAIRAQRKSEHLRGACSLDLIFLSFLCVLCIYIGMNIAGIPRECALR